MNNQKILLTNAALWAAYDGFTSLYLSAFALTLGASNTVIGLLGAIPFLASILMQIPGAALVQHYHRKLIIFLFGTLGRILWIPLLMCPFLFIHSLWFVVFFYFLSRLCESTTEPAYTTLIADSVPSTRRGTFTSKRLRILGFFGILAMIFGGLWLKQFPKASPVGFALLFFFGIFLGLLAAFVILKLKEKPYPDHEHHGIKEFFTMHGPLRTFLIFSLGFNFAYMLASPFFTVYMLKTLDISYAYYGVVSAISVVAQLVVSRFIGTLTDQFGDKPVAILGTIGTAFVPIVFLTITPHTFWLLILVQIYSGIVWAAADISRFNLLLDLTDSKQRAFQIAEYNLYANISLVIAPILGGYLSEHVAFILSGIPLIFVLSSVLRLISVGLLFSIKEPRAKHEYSSVAVLREAMHFHPNKGLITGIQIVKRITQGLVR